ncbi:MAG: hypothetical protein CL910_02270 [Deltaproteobacteria bacterium]|jgi:hypothetical protein|nr:hypothetical protein [Deltaproteobacteria bacterium]
MSGDSEIDLKGLRDLLGLPEPEVSEPTPFAQNVAAVLAKALAAMRAEGMIEVEDANVEGLASEITDAALESSSLKRLPLRIVKTLIHSDLVEEVYGTDEEISAALRPFLDGM